MTTPSFATAARGADLIAQGADPITQDPDAWAASCMNSIVDLGGTSWSIREALGDTWQWYLDKPVTARNNAGAALDKAERAPGWLPARVPGSVIGDLHRAGEIPDPYAGRQSRQAEWVATRSWVYRREFDVPELRPGERAVLCFDGVDPGGRVFVDGTQVGELDGLYHAARFDITAHVADAGRHRLAVIVPPVPPTEPQVGRTDRVTRHGPRMGHGWDFCPRLVHQGIWRDVRLEIGVLQVSGLQIRPDIGEDLHTGRIHVRADVETPAGTAAHTEVVILDGDHIVARADAHTTATRPDGTAVRHRIDATITVDHPRLWWPRGLGEQHTYTVELRAGTDATPATTVSRRTGFRHVRMEANHRAPRGALPYTAVVNGRRLPLVGWNWAPADALYRDVTPDKVAHLVDLAARSGARVLRVWGGGLIETPEFYDACDAAGILVWQEFSQSSSGMQSAPSHDPAFVRHLREEARAVVPSRTHHPSLLMWGGGNELEDDDGPLDESRSPALAALRDEVAALDPGRHWVPTSPTGPFFHNRLDVIERHPEGMHDVHGPWEHQGLEDHYTLYNHGRPMAHTEFGVEGMANRRVWEALVPAEDRWPVGRDNPVYRHLGEWWNNADLVQACFGGRLYDAEEFRRASQFLQTTGLAYAVEADRRRWPHCSMVIPWQLAESYPNAWCTAVVDHAGEPKPAYHAVARAYLPERVTGRVERLAHGGGRARVEAWVWSERGRSSGGRVAAGLVDDHGRVVAADAWPLPGPVGDPQAVGVLEVDLADVPTTGVMVWVLEWFDADGSLVDRECMPLATGRDLADLQDLKSADVDVAISAPPGAQEWIVDVRHRAGPVVVGLQLCDDRPRAAGGWAVVDIDPRPLLPGEARRFTVQWRNASGPRRLVLESWNTEPVVVTEGANP